MVKGNGARLQSSCMSGDQNFKDAPNKRGGKKAKRKKELWELTEQGKHNPKSKSEPVPVSDSASDYNAGRFGVSSLVGRIGPVGRTTLGIITVQTRQLLIQRVAQGHLQEKFR